MELIDGGVSEDSRGIVTFFNDFDLKKVKRFYIVENHLVGTVRGWHGHKKEGKYVFVIRGVAKIAAVDMKTGKLKIGENLSANNPQVLYIPPGNYNGSLSIVDGTKIIYFSTSTLEESKKDDFRKPEDWWEDVWSLF